MEIINFNKKIYKLKVVKQAVKEFKALANFKITEKEKYIEVKIDKIAIDYKKILRDEFANYVLVLMSQVNNLIGGKIFAMLDLQTLKKFNDQQGEER